MMFVYQRETHRCYATQMETPYIYTLSGRRPMTLFGLAASLAFVALSWSYGAPWYALAPALLIVPIMLTTIIRNPVYGIRIDRHAMEIDRNGEVKRILLTAIDYIKITTWSESSDTTIHLKDGNLHQIPQMTRPPIGEFRDVLAKHGVAVTNASVPLARLG